MLDFSKVEGFDWDKGNVQKNEKHGVTPSEAEQVFFNWPLLVLEDEKHSQGEERYHAYGKTNEGRSLQITFTFRSNGTRLRVISARTMSARERKRYDEEPQTGP